MTFLVNVLNIGIRGRMPERFGDHSPQPDDRHGRELVRGTNRPYEVGRNRPLGD